jgi:TPP-dependent indolepyruvate ferredoxin oxidoreductase alpha subunit
MLEELEAHYNQMLSGVRALIAAERGQPIEQQSVNGAASATRQPFEKLKKADAASEIFQKKGNMSAVKLFKALKARGHPVKSRNSVSTMLSTNERFERKGKASWGLA